VFSSVFHKLIYVRKKVFQNSASVFLEFARIDVQDGSRRGLANSLTNAKRAIANRVDELLYAHGMRGFAKQNNWGFPAKIAKLSGLGISTPQVLHNLINKRRNLLEHEYVIPETRDEVQDVIDIAELYLGNTEKYIEPGVIQAIFGADRPSGQPGETLAGIVAPSYGIVFDFDQNQFQLFGVLGTGNRILISEVGEEVSAKLFRRILVAFLGRLVPVTSCETVDVFWSRFQ